MLNRQGLPAGVFSFPKIDQRTARLMMTPELDAENAGRDEENQKKHGNGEFPIDARKIQGENLKDPFGVRRGVFLRTGRILWIHLLLKSLQQFGHVQIQKRRVTSNRTAHINGRGELAVIAGFQRAHVIASKLGYLRHVFNGKPLLLTSSAQLFGDGRHQRISGVN